VAMPKRVKVPNTDVPSVPKEKVRAYPVLYHINEGFEQISSQLQLLDKSGVWRQVSKRLQVIVAETRAEVNFELVEFLQERELRDWTRLGAARQRADTRTKQAKD
jgi:hypothetical protein